MVVASRNARQEAQLAARLNLDEPPLTFNEIRKLFIDRGFSGNALYREIINYAEGQTQKISCFVAGTLVHTKEGLKPIEQIKVGDWVLSKPENGEGETGYKRVTRTFEHDDREVYLVSYSVIDEHNQRVYEHVVATGEHPFWVRQLVNQCDPDEIEGYSAWLNVGKFDKFCRDTQKDPVFELQDGRLARFELAGPIVRTVTPGMGLIFSDPVGSFSWDPCGIGVDFSSGHPELTVNERGRFKYAYLGFEYENKERDPDSDSIYLKTSCHPLLRKVYNLEVEDYHTYFVGRLGIWVHNKHTKKLPGEPEGPRRSD